MVAASTCTPTDGHRDSLTYSTYKLKRIEGKRRSIFHITVVLERKVEACASSLDIQQDTDTERSIQHSTQETEFPSHRRRARIYSWKQLSSANHNAIATQLQM